MPLSQLILPWLGIGKQSPMSIVSEKVVSVMLDLAGLAALDRVDCLVMTSLSFPRPCPS